MADYASVIGGNGTHLSVDAASPKDPVAYFFDSTKNWNLDFGNGDDVLWAGGSGGNLKIAGGNGDDRILSGRGDDTLGGDNNNDWISAGEGRDLVSGGNENDTILGGAGDDTLGGDNANDSLDGGAGRDMLDGGNGDDMLFGGEGDDVIRGGTGADTLSGGAGNDTLWGEQGTDTFLFDTNNFGADVIKDFGAGDRLLLKANLNGTGIAAPGDLLAHNMVSGDAQTTIIQIGADQIRIEGLGVADFKAAIATYVKIG